MVDTPTPSATPDPLLWQYPLTGPGARIHGADISKWQHPHGAAIDFTKMYNAGIRFLMIKGSDSKNSSDLDAVRYLAKDRAGAQAAGILTSFYHYAYLPDTTDPVAIAQDARAQGFQVLWRLESIGGYNAKDLPVALDLENNCVRTNSLGKCTKFMNRKFVTLWTKTFLAFLKEQTGKAPLIYSYPKFLESAIIRDVEFRNYPLWISHYTTKIFDPLISPATKTGGCFVTSWTNTHCDMDWQFWQYTSCGIAGKYGVPGSRLDLSVYNADAKTLLQLLTGEWQPREDQLMPFNEPTTLTIATTEFGSIQNATQMLVDVHRPDDSPVVTGTITFSLQNVDAKNLPKFVASTTRMASGRWKMAITGLPVGVYNGRITFSDVSQTHASSSSEVTFIVTGKLAPSVSPSASPRVSPTPKPTKSTPAKPTPVKNNQCANQVRL